MAELSKRLHGLLLLPALVCCGSLCAQQDPSIPQITLPTAPHSVRSAKPVAGVLPISQDGFPAEAARITQSDTNWVDSVQVYSRTRAVIVALKLGWAYDMPSGLEYHQSAVLKPEFSLQPGYFYRTPAQDVPPRPTAKNLLVFVEQVTFADASVYNADHAKVEAFYKDCCTGANAGRVPPTPGGHKQADTPGGAVQGPMLSEDLKPINFDVVSFRRTDKPGGGREFPEDGDFITYRGSTLVSLILFAHISSSGYTTVTGAPDWANSELYDFTAKVAPEDVAAWKALPLTDKRAMVGRLLVDALKLKLHQQAEPQPVYELVVAKGGPKLMEYHAGDTLIFRPGTPPQSGRIISGIQYYMVEQDVTMGDMATALSGPGRSGRTVIDKTGLTGTYNFTLPIMPASIAPRLQQALEDAGLPSLDIALKQLGLALVPAKDPVDEIVIDHIERPETN